MSKSYATKSWATGRPKLPVPAPLEPAGRARDRS